MPCAHSLCHECAHAIMMLAHPVCPVCDVDVTESLPNAALGLFAEAVATAGSGAAPAGVAVEGESVRFDVGAAVEGAEEDGGGRGTKRHKPSRRRLLDDAACVFHSARQVEAWCECHHGALCGECIALVEHDKVMPFDEVLALPSALAKAADLAHAYSAAGTAMLGRVEQDTKAARAHLERAVAEALEGVQAEAVSLRATLEAKVASMEQEVRKQRAVAEKLIESRANQVTVNAAQLVCAANTWRTRGEGVGAAVGERGDALDADTMVDRARALEFLYDVRPLFDQMDDGSVPLGPVVPLPVFKLRTSGGRTTAALEDSMRLLRSAKEEETLDARRALGIIEAEVAELAATRKRIEDGLMPDLGDLEDEDERDRATAVFEDVMATVDKCRPWFHTSVVAVRLFEFLGSAANVAFLMPTPLPGKFMATLLDIMEAVEPKATAEVVTAWDNAMVATLDRGGSDHDPTELECAEAFFDASRGPLLVQRLLGRVDVGPDVLEAVCQVISKLATWRMVVQFGDVGPSVVAAAKARPFNTDLQVGACDALESPAVISTRGLVDGLVKRLVATFEDDDEVVGAALGAVLLHLEYWNAYTPSPTGDNDPLVACETFRGVLERRPACPAVVELGVKYFCGIMRNGTFFGEETVRGLNTSGFLAVLVAVLKRHTSEDVMHSGCRLVECIANSPGVVENVGLATDLLVWIFDAASKGRFPSVQEEALINLGALTRGKERRFRVCAFLPAILPHVWAAMEEPLGNVAEIRGWACNALANLAWHGETTMSAVESGGMNTDVVEELIRGGGVRRVLVCVKTPRGGRADTCAIDLLCLLCRHPEGAQRTMEAAGPGIVSFLLALVKTASAKPAERDDRQAVVIAVSRAVASVRLLAALVQHPVPQRVVPCARIWDCLLQALKGSMPIMGWAKEVFDSLAANAECAAQVSPQVLAEVAHVICSSPPSEAVYSTLFNISADARVRPSLLADSTLFAEVLRGIHSHPDSTVIQVCGRGVLSRLTGGTLGPSKGLPQGDILEVRVCRAELAPLTKEELGAGAEPPAHLLACALLETSPSPVVCMAVDDFFPTQPLARGLALEVTKRVTAMVLAGIPQSADFAVTLVLVLSVALEREDPAALMPHRIHVLGSGGVQAMRAIIDAFPSLHESARICHYVAACLTHLAPTTLEEVNALSAALGPDNLREAIAELTKCSCSTMFVTPALGSRHLEALTRLAIIGLAESVVCAEVIASTRKVFLWSNGIMCREACASIGNLMATPAGRSAMSPYRVELISVIKTRLASPDDDRRTRHALRALCETLCETRTCPPI